LSDKDGLTNHNTAGIQKSKFYYGFVIVIAGACISMVMWGSRLAFTVLFPPVLAEFGWSRAATAGGFSLTWVCCGALGILVGRMNDKIGPRVILTIAGILLGAGYLLMSRMNSLWELYLFYFIVSLGMSAAFIPVMSTIARWFIKMRAFMSGVILAGTALALITIVPSANQLSLTYGWRWAYAIVGIISLVVVVVGAQFLRYSPTKMGKVPYGYEKSKEATSDSQTHGLTFKEATRTYQVYLMGLIYFCTYFTYWAIMVHLIIYAISTGISPAQAVFITSFIGVGGICGRTLGGILADRIGAKFPMIIGVGLVLFSLIWLLISRELWMFFIFGVIFGFGQGGLATMESPIVAHIYGIRAHGAILGLVFFIDTFGGALGPFLTGYIFDTTHFYSPAFIACIILNVVCLVSIVLLRPAAKLQQFVHH
jgi:MFS family permease